MLPTTPLRGAAGGPKALGAPGFGTAFCGKAAEGHRAGAQSTGVWTMPITLRPGRPADAPALAAIHRAALDAALPGLVRPWTEAETLAWFAGELLARCRVTVAEGAGQPVGYLAREGEELLHLYVTPSLHRRGIGAMLLERAKAAAPGGLRLACFRRNRAALAFHGQRGFRMIACRDATAHAEGEPDVILAWAPPPDQYVPLGTCEGETA
jgi:GNAT superfamily N-acetyltransferase